MTGFQSTHPRGVRPHTPETSSSRRNFNPRTHVGCDRSPRSSIPTSGYFNPRTHVGCDLDHERQVVGHHISIHAPTWGATSEAFGIPNLKAFQSTHPRGVRRTTPTRRRSCGISIHAPTWGATSLQPWQINKKKISIHAPTWGATRSGSQDARGKSISIHAPTWGATAIKDCCCQTQQFQSTHPRGVRRGCGETTRATSNFNPRTHVGCDTQKKIGGADVIPISIHAPTWGATTEIERAWAAH